MRVRISTVRAAIALRTPQPRPTRRLVQMPAKLGWTDKCFGEKQAVAKGSRPVSTQASNHRGKRKGSEVPETIWRAKNEKRVLLAIRCMRVNWSSRFQPIHRSRWRHLKAPVLPAGKAHPTATRLENISQTTTGKTLEAEVMMLVHQPVPACALIRTSKAHGHIAEMKSVRGAPEYV